MTARTYPEGVPCWVDTEQPDLGAAQRLYGELFGWTLETVTRPGGPDRYVIARLAGRDAAGVGAGGGDGVGWNTYVAVDDADAAAGRVAAAGGRVVAGPVDAGEGGRVAACVDPFGAGFRLWQARRRLGAQAVNEPGAWNFSDLHVADPASAAEFYRRAFDWVVDDIGFGQLLRVPGYGDHLAATVDPGIRDRQRAVGAPPGFEDAVGWIVPAEPGSRSRWHVTFTVGDRDATVELAQRLGARVSSVADDEWTRSALVRDPQGALFTVSQFTPPS